MAEFLGTFWLVFGGCGSAVIAASVTDAGIGMLGVAIAFGLTVMTMAYAIGHISGCHLNPAVSIGLAVAKRFRISELPAYISAQLAGAIAGASVLYVIARGKAGFQLSAGLAANGYGVHSPGGYSMAACLLAEVVLTFMFVMIVLGATSTNVPAGFAPIAIGLGLTLVHLIGIPVTNLSVNPARSTGPAFLVGEWAQPTVDVLGRPIGRSDSGGSGISSSRWRSRLQDFEVRCRHGGVKTVVDFLTQEETTKNAK